MLRIQSKQFFLVLLFFFVASQATLASSFEFTQACKLASDAILVLDFKTASVLLDLEKKNHPDNFAPFLLDYQKRAVQVFISENRNDFESLKNDLDQALEGAQKLDQASPRFRYEQAELYFLEAVLRYKFGEHYTAALHIFKGYKLIEENTTLFPDFLPNYKYAGLLHAAIGMVPGQYKWLTNLAGFNGDIFQGINELKRLANKTSVDPLMMYEQEQGRMILIFVLMHFKQDLSEAKAYGANILDKHPGPLKSFIKSNLAWHAGETDEAIRILEAIHKDGSFNFPYLDFALGNAKLCRMDKDANVSLEAFLKTYTGENYIKSANQKLSWFYLINNDETRFEFYKGHVLTDGTANIDEDRQAMIEAALPGTPNLKLLQARLLFDGGYVKKALAVFVGAKIQTDFPTLRDQLEVTYRVARIYHRLGQTSKAITYYQESLKNGYNLSYYFAANAALQLGIVYEEMGDLEKSAFYFNKCLSLRNHEYQYSLDQKAKAGLQRVCKK